MPSLELLHAFDLLLNSYSYLTTQTSTKKGGLIMRLLTSLRDLSVAAVFAVFLTVISTLPALEDAAAHTLKGEQSDITGQIISV